MFWSKKTNEREIKNWKIKTKYFSSFQFFLFYNWNFILQIFKSANFFCRNVFNKTWNLLVFFISNTDVDSAGRHVAAATAAAAIFPSPAQLLAAHLGQFGLLPPPPLAHQSSSSTSPAHRGISLTPPPECGTRTGTKKDIFRPYCLEDPVTIKYERSQTPPSVENFYSAYTASYLKYRNIEDINTAHAILDLSKSSSSHQKSTASRCSAYSPNPNSSLSHDDDDDDDDDDADSSTSTPLLSPALSTNSNDKGVDPDTYKINDGKTTAYTYEAFFASDGRSRKKPAGVEPPPQQKPRYTCSECGKNYATSSNLSRHKQTHRSLESGSAKKCHVCDKMYVSMPALSMHILTHNLNHRCDVCGKMFSRPWLLQGHMRSHSGDKPYGCAHCGKCFADRSNLRAHMQTHSAFKNFKCKRCNKSFALKSYLNKHYESACFKDQPIPSIDTPPCTPAPSDFCAGSDGMVSPGARSSTSSSGSHHHHHHELANHHFSSAGPSIASLLSVLPSSLHSPTEIRTQTSILGI